MQAADQEHTESQFSLGVMHLKGIATRTSPVRALNFLAAAAYNGHLLAEYNLAMMHLAGIGVEPNCNTALKFLKEVPLCHPYDPSETPCRSLSTVPGAQLCKKDMTPFKTVKFELF